MRSERRPQCASDRGPNASSAAFFVVFAFGFLLEALLNLSPARSAFSCRCARCFVLSAWHAALVWYAFFFLYSGFCFFYDFGRVWGVNGTACGRGEGGGCSKVSGSNSSMTVAVTTCSSPSYSITFSFPASSGESKPANSSTSSSSDGGGGERDWVAMTHREHSQPVREMRSELRCTVATKKFCQILQSRRSPGRIEDECAREEE